MSKAGLHAPSDAVEVKRPLHLAGPSAGAYAVALDPSGKLHFQTRRCRRRSGNRPGSRSAGRRNDRSGVRNSRGSQIAERQTLRCSSSAQFHLGGRQRSIPVIATDRIRKGYYYAAARLAFPFASDFGFSIQAKANLYPSASSSRAACRNETRLKNGSFGFPAATMTP
jgi:hypothetical protein